MRNRVSIEPAKTMPIPIPRGKGSRKTANQTLHQLNARLGELLIRRDFGLLTQREFEEELDEIGRTCPTPSTITECEPQPGGTQLVRRDASTRQSQVRFHFLALSLGGISIPARPVAEDDPVLLRLKASLKEQEEQEIMAKDSHRQRG